MDIKILEAELASAIRLSRNIDTVDEFHLIMIKIHVGLLDLLLSDVDSATIRVLIDAFSSVVSHQQAWIVEINGAISTLIQEQEPSSLH